MQIADNMKAAGRRTSETAKDSRGTLTATLTSETSRWAKRTAKVYTHG